MIKRVLSIAAALVLTGSGAFAAQSCPARAGVPDSAFREGTVDGAWVGVVLNEVGGNGGALSATVYTLDQYGAIAMLGPVRVATAGGGSMDAEFLDGKLYLTNSVFNSADAHCCPSHLAAQRFGIHKAKVPAIALEREGTVVFAAPKLTPTADEKACDELFEEREQLEIRKALSAATFTN